MNVTPWSVCSACLWPADGARVSIRISSALILSYQRPFRSLFRLSWLFLWNKTHCQTLHRLVTIAEMHVFSILHCHHLQIFSLCLNRTNLFTYLERLLFWSVSPYGSKSKQLSSTSQSGRAPNTVDTPTLKKNVEPRKGE